MRAATMISLGASAALGLAALFVARVWLPGSAPSGPAKPAGGPEVPVVVAAVPLPYGAKLEAKHLTLAKLPASAVPAGAYRSIDQVLGGAQGSPVVLVPLAVREPLLPQKLSGTGARPSVAAAIAPGMRAYSIRVSDVSSVGGNALPGDRVDVLLTRDLSTDREEQKFVTDVVIQNVRVLGVDLNADPTSTKTAVPKTATLEVTVEDAQKLAIAADLGQLSLALRRTGGAELADVQRIASDHLGAGPARVTMPALTRVQGPASPMPSTSRSVAAAPSGRRLVVVHGDHSNEVTVASEWPRGGV